MDDAFNVTKKKRMQWRQTENWDTPVLSSDPILRKDTDGYEKERCSIFTTLKLTFSVITS